tara:strand:+ start:1406 stop:2107 length:702 start_codon:yes stop_codon:yes gene_type:complete
MKYSSQIVIKKLDNKFIFNNKDSSKNLTDLMIKGKLDINTQINVEWINDGKWVKKHYQRKGMMKMFNDLYLYSSIKKTRSFREFEILNYLIFSDFSTCKPLIGWVEYIGGILYRANLITENIPGMNFKNFLTSKDPVKNILDKIYKDIGSAVANMHKLSIFHGDLNINNIIVNADKNSVSIIDFDKSCYKKLSDNDKAKNIQRFKRSLIKNKLYNRNYFNLFLNSYNLTTNSL